MTLKEFYQNLPDRNAPKADFRRNLAKECKVAPMTVYRWLAGDIVPDALKREKIAEVIGIPEDELFPERATNL